MGKPAINLQLAPCCQYAMIVITICLLLCDRLIPGFGYYFTYGLGALSLVFLVIINRSGIEAEVDIFLDKFQEVIDDISD